MNVSKISELNKTFLFFLVFTIVSSLIAYHIVDKGYDMAYSAAAYDIAAQ